MTSQTSQTSQTDNKVYRCYFQRVRDGQLVEFSEDIKNPDFAALRAQSEPMFLYAEPIS